MVKGEAIDQVDKYCYFRYSYTYTFTDNKHAWHKTTDEVIKKVHWSLFFFTGNVDHQCSECMRIFCSCVFLANHYTI